MPVIALESSKGGTGKTTTTVHLAVTLAPFYDRVTVVDADPQHSTADWATAADRAGDPLPCEVVTAATVRGLTQTVRGASHGSALVLIDTPPGHGDLIDAATAAADLVIVTSQPSEMDVDRALSTLRVVSATDTPALVLLTAVGLGERLGVALRSWLEDSGAAPLATTVIPRRTHFREAFGTTPGRLGAYAGLADEIRSALHG